MKLEMKNTTRGFSDGNCRKRTAIKGGVTAGMCVLLSLSFIGCKEKDKSSSDIQVADGTNSKAVDADNSARNARDRAEGTLTPGDQGNSQADRDVTQKVRKALVMDTNYSTTAKNVKIITTNGKVTLRGPVKTEAEKTGIVALAKGIVGEGNVEDQLEVKVNP